jgi:hypothetical protein
LWLDMSGSPLSDAARITERFRRVNYGTLEIEITVDDPKAYTKQWTIKMNQTIKLDTDLLERPSAPGSQVKTPLEWVDRGRRRACPPPRRHDRRRRKYGNDGDINALGAQRPGLRVLQL